MVITNLNGIKGAIQVSELAARTVFLSSLVKESSDPDLKKTLLLNDRRDAALHRDHLARKLSLSDDPQVFVLDLAGISYTPSALQELILPLVQRIRGGEHGTVRLLISTTDPGVSDFIRYMAEVNQLPLYLSQSPFEIGEGTPVGALTNTERSTLDSINMLGGKVTVSELAELEGLRPSAAANRLVNLDRAGYLVRLQRGRREGDIFVEPRSATAKPVMIDELTENSEGESGIPVGPTGTAYSQP